VGRTKGDDVTFRAGADQNGIVWVNLTNGEAAARFFYSLR
jgi:hypothetical protein